MIKIVQALYFISAFFLFYNYLGYGILLWILVKLRRRPAVSFSVAPAYEPPVTLIVAAYNEAAFIARKAENTLQLDYPSDKFDILFVTDGSTDGTPEILQQFTGIKVIHQDARRGKTAAINRAMQQVRTPIVIFCDANTFLNKTAIRALVKHYTDESVGAVAGEKRVQQQDGDDQAAGTEGIYWKYESYLKKLDADFYSVVGAAGELFSVRTALFQPVEPAVILDDFVISLRVNLQGYRVAYAPDAYAMESPSDSLQEEHKRKVRISAGGFQSIVLLRSLLNIFRDPVLSFQYISHRVLRWTISPLSLPVLLISNIWLVMHTASPWYQLSLLLQAGAYIAALAGFILAKKQIKIKIFYVPFYFLFMNIAVYEGFFRYIAGKQSAAWEKSKRKTPAPLNN
ncbi:Glycosyltransferase, catalytic subunit of cellulose synthase and poly-beta-1,6-N-acetylglucosamine synthase [Chitinophaga costaii]|uniref:Glycosyltransferase, catalytic subunit of cellulose synthase and poly-beta-1,6-N-acetylglucosamine synthase n=1 Tax=Chitinophaga costaii TaxID=1335309 RepID=A0A1C4FI98_9BACT|nr:glycosyltransferase family 2 protein [Chitinophaga costaii]PUZ20299.1 glycosyltransferase family 2 protein [Chitinophaga costaii]SCC55606.1 Glycosyltransferase, catalytic subunit of cellulose synthase and poly-beta-1,6-N-acetylglucosamine synthase [Chitinophaga costaii]